MEKKKEISISRKDVNNILKILIIPLVLTFIIEHFGRFEYTTNIPAPTAADVRITDLYFYTPFGSKIYDDVYDKNIKYETGSDGIGRLNGKYTGKLPYYFQGLIKDIIYPIILSLILIIYLFVSKKYKIKLDK